MRKWIDLVMRVQQQPRHDLIETPTELALQDCSPLCLPLRMPRDVLQSKCRDDMVAGGGGKRREAQVKTSTVRRRKHLQPGYVDSPARQQKHHRLGRSVPGWREAGQACRAQQAGSQQIREALRQRPVERLGPCAGVLAEVGSDKPPTSKMRTLVLNRRQRALRTRVKEYSKGETSEGALVGPGILTGLMSGKWAVEGGTAKGGGHLPECSVHFSLWRPGWSCRAGLYPHPPLSLPGCCKHQHGPGKKVMSQAVWLVQGQGPWALMSYWRAPDRQGFQESHAAEKWGSRSGNQSFLYGGNPWGGVVHRA